MTRIGAGAALALLVAGVAGCACHGRSGADQGLAAEASGRESAQETAMNGAISPDGEAHPGTILYQDRIEGTEEARPANASPQSVAWVRISGTWVAVTRVESTGTRERRRITRFGGDGQMLDSTVARPDVGRESEPDEL